MGPALTFEKPKFPDVVQMECATPPGARTPVLPSVLMSRVADLLRALFSDPANIWHTQLRDMLFSDDHEKTKVFVMMGFSTTPETEQVETFPRVVVNGTDAYFGNLTPVTDGLFVNTDSPEGEVFGLDDSLEHFEGQLHITCASRGALEALLMAESVVMFFRQNSNYIRKDLCLSNFDVRVLKSPRKAEGADGIYESSLTVAWSSGMAWTSVQDGPALGAVGAQGIG